MQLTDEQRAFREELREYLDENVEPVVDEQDKEPFTRAELLEYVDDLRELGVGFDPETAESYFGDLRRYTICSEEMSRVWPSLNVALNMSFPSLFAQFASETTRDAMRPKLNAGECIGCLAVTEPGGGSDTARPRTTARKEGDEFVINGEKTWVGNAQIADVALVVAHDESTDSQDMFLVDQETAPFETEGISKLGWKAVPNGHIYLDDVRVPVDNRLSMMFENAIMEGKDISDIVPFPESVTQLFLDQKPLNATFSFMRTGMAFMAVGIMQAAFDESLAYAKERETFGEPIGQHQLIQEKLYDIKCALETSRCLAHRVVELLEEGSPDARMMSSLAKGYACEKSVDATSDAIQIHGGEGLKTENRLERYYRDARTMPIPDGTTEIQKLIVGKELTGMAAY
ncbi:acyl-CoA dehydrogenase family protein [Haladaptatus salinisoli]|uniref:acyl-CoA dehydrogenase family protein n=1 Tax=Haladaptatus salinisoli TaxID=2884876 RepID=UPI001D0B12D3|nr:acyl-CoA dehydrogenase family protein [Haladaptatus salinisoli]